MAKSGSERTTAWRKSLIEQGYKQKTYLLSPPALRALAKLAVEYGSEAAALEHLLREQDKRRAR